MLQKLISLWKVENSLKEIYEAKADLIVPICYALIGGKRLAPATELNFKKAMEFLKMMPEAKLGFGNCTYFSAGEEIVESKLKKKMLDALPSIDFVEVSLQNSITEAENIYGEIIRKHWEPRCILIVTGEIHSRRARRIWRKTFPHCEILVRCTSRHNEVHQDYPIPDQRTLSRWFIVNIVAHLIAIIPFGISILKRMSHAVER